MTTAEASTGTAMKAMDTPTARASMLVATASRHSRLAVRSAGASSSPSPPRRAPQAMRPPMRASRPKATQWSTASMYSLTLLPRNQPIRGIMNWKKPNHRPILAACCQPKPGMAMPLDTDTAKASRARLTAMRKISSTHITS